MSETLQMVLIILGAGTILSLIVFVFAIWFASEVEYQKVELRRMPILGYALLLSGVGLVAFVWVVNRMIVLPLNTFLTVGSGMTSILAAELIMMGIFLCRSADSQRRIISKIND